MIIADKQYQDVFQIGVTSEMPGVKEMTNKPDVIKAALMQTVPVNNAAQDKMIKATLSVGKPDPLLQKHRVALNVYAKEIYNDAIETAAQEIEDFEFNLAERIRKLKK